MDQFHDHFKVGKVGSDIGLVMAIYTAGQIIGSFFTGFLLDTLGRRGGMVVGSCFIIIGSIVQSSANPLSAFIAGRLIVGIGVPVVTTAAPTYIVEMAYPTWRGTAGGAYNVFGWYIGSLSMSRTNNPEIARLHSEFLILTLMVNSRKLVLLRYIQHP